MLFYIMIIFVITIDHKQFWVPLFLYLKCYFNIETCKSYVTYNVEQNFE